MSIGGIFEESGAAAVFSLHLDFAAAEEDGVVEVVTEVDVVAVEVEVVVVGVDEAEDCSNILMIPSLGLLLLGVVSGGTEVFGNFSLSFIFVNFLSDLGIGFKNS